MTASRIAILLIEDSETDRILIERLLERCGGAEFTVIHRPTLAGGMELLQAGGVDAVLLDLTLPDSGGPRACEEIRDRYPAIPVIVLTGSDDEDAAIQSLNHGAQDFLVKGRTDARLLSRSVRYAIERKRSERELQRAYHRIERQQHLAEVAHLARLNTMGEMASGMAHELNQPLTALVGFAETALVGFESGSLPQDDLNHILRRIVSESQRAAEIIRRLRRLVRKREPELTQTRVNTLVAEVVEMIEHEAERGGFQIHCEPGQDVPEIMADRVQIQQVVLNLVRNGMEAMDLVPVEERRLVISTAYDGSVVTVSVVDNGLCQTGTDLSRLFEPYYSTRKTGLGMGLAICRSIIESHAGTLTAAHNAHRGLTFSFTLPADSRRRRTT